MGAVGVWLSFLLEQQIRVSGDADNCLNLSISDRCDKNHQSSISLDGISLWLVSGVSYWKAQKLLYALQSTLVHIPSNILYHSTFPTAAGSILLLWPEKSQLKWFRCLIRMPPCWGGILGMSRCRTDPQCLGFPREELEDVVRDGDVWAALLRFCDPISSGNRRMEMLENSIHKVGGQR